MFITWPRIKVIVFLVLIVSVLLCLKRFTCVYHEVALLGIHMFGSRYLASLNSHWDLILQFNYRNCLPYSFQAHIENSGLPIVSGIKFSLTFTRTVGCHLGTFLIRFLLDFAHSWLYLTFLWDGFWVGLLSGLGLFGFVIWIRLFVPEIMNFVIDHVFSGDDYGCYPSSQATFFAPALKNLWILPRGL